MGSLWNTVVTNRNGPFKGLLGKIDPKVLEEGAKRLFEETNRRRDECNAKGGHEEEVIGIAYAPLTRAYVRCSHCDAYYDRPLNLKEQEEMQRAMSTPIY